MPMKYRINFLISAVALAAILAAVYFMFRALSVDGVARMLEYRATFVAFLIIVLCMEARVRMGFRLPRGKLFAIHLIAAVPFILLLGTLSFMALAPWADLLCLALFLVTLGTGSVLFGKNYLRTRTAGSYTPLP